MFSNNVVCARISVRASSPSSTTTTTYTSRHHLCVDRGACVLTRGFLFARLFCEIMGKFGVIDDIPPAPAGFIQYIFKGNQNLDHRAYSTDQCYHYKFSL